MSRFVVALLIALGLAGGGCRTPQPVYPHPDPTMDVEVPPPTCSDGSCPVATFASGIVGAAATIPFVAFYGLCLLSESFRSEDPCDPCAAGPANDSPPPCRVPGTYYPGWEQGGGR